MAVWPSFRGGILVVAPHLRQSDGLGACTVVPQCVRQANEPGCASAQAASGNIPLDTSGFGLGLVLPVSLRHSSIVLGFRHSRRSCSVIG